MNNAETVVCSLFRGAFREESDADRFALPLALRASERQRLTSSETVPSIRPALHLSVSHQAATKGSRLPS